MRTQLLLRTLGVVALLLVGYVAGWVSSTWLGPSVLPQPIASLLGPGALVNQSSPAALRSQFGVFWEVWGLVEDEYYGRSKLDTTRMIQGAIRGMLASLDDDYTVYQEPMLAAQTQDHLKGKLGGIGTYLRITDGRAFLYKPFRGGPAYEAGLRQDDEIIAVDGQEIAALITGLDQNEAAVQVAEKLRGPENTEVNVSIRRASDGATLELTLTRRDIVVPSVEWQLFDQNIAYIRIGEFKANTTNEFDQALSELLPGTPRAIILDLRNNPGGLLNSAQEVLGRFYNGAALIEEDGKGGERTLNTFAGSQQIPAVPLIVLVNGGSASAAEIVAGALLDQRIDTTLLGEKTFGKGSVQNIHVLSDGGNARITFAHWLTPKRTIIHNNGLMPTVEVAFADDPNSLAPCVADRQPAVGQSQCGDTQLAAAIARLRGP